MSLLIANKVKTNVGLIFLISLLYVSLFMCPSVSDLYNNSYQSLLVRYSSHATIRYSAHNRNCFVHSQLHTRLTCLTFLYLSVPLSLMFVVLGLFGTCSMYLCIAYTLPIVAFAFVAYAFSISFILMVIVFVGIAYYFQCNRY